MRVMVAGKPAGLMFVGDDQINLKIPTDAPDEGTAETQVCVWHVCSDPVPVRFSSHEAYLSVQGTAYVNMPIWIEADMPVPYDIFYPYATWPWAFLLNGFGTVFASAPARHDSPGSSFPVSSR